MVCSPADSNVGIGHGCRCSWTLLPQGLKLKGNVRQVSPVRSEVAFPSGMKGHGMDGAER